ncbi:hypothetical protein V474_07900 [Novosphingobium barchaimii LL02]|uniref:Uncharacterized protein n=1 Tax=Novosphingobium barchaimii LL02 TaxID=1114963 RepID=A0A0J8B0U8_9SPHN|nr:hypothetical protein [Novosphingobium barchaimii]KMS60000.1 hypothetical protein V474_07900 [Novosphingobium barchaimii LL02]
MKITLQTRYQDGSVAHQRDVDADDLNAALAWAVASWAPAQGPRCVDGPGRYLNRNLMVSIDGAEFEPAYAALARACTPVGLAA